MYWKTIPYCGKQYHNDQNMFSQHTGVRVMSGPDPLGEAPARGGAPDAALEPRLAELAQDPGAQVPILTNFNTTLTIENPPLYQSIIK